MLKMKRSNQAGFSLLQFMVVMAISFTVMMGMSQSLFKNFAARKMIASKLNYEEVTKFNRSLFTDLASKPPATGCLNIQAIEAAVQASTIATLERDVTANLSQTYLKRLNQPQSSPIKAAAQRCHAQKNITSTTNPNDNQLYFCLRFDRPNSGDESGLTGSEHAFGEFKLEFIDTHTGQPISCNNYRLSANAGVNVYYNLYWINSSGLKDKYSKYGGYYYVSR